MTYKQDGVPLEEKKKHDFSLTNLLKGIRINKGTSWMYGMAGKRTKKELYNMEGPLHWGMPSHEELALSSLQSDTRGDWIREMMEDKGMSRQEAENTIANLLKQGLVKEVTNEIGQKVMVIV